MSLLLREILDKVQLAFGFFRASRQSAAFAQNETKKKKKNEDEDDDTTKKKERISCGKIHKRETHSSREETIIFPRLV